MIQVTNGEIFITYAIVAVVAFAVAAFMLKKAS